MYKFMVLHLSIKPAKWVTFRGLVFSGIGVGILLETCDLSDDDVDASLCVLEFH
jgi:hypothetical protein